MNETKPSIAEKAAAVAEAVTNPNLSTDQLEAAVRAVLQKQHHAAIEAAKPKEPDWSSLTEQEAMSQDVYIPVIDHEITNYMNIQLKDPNYEVVWAHNSQRRVGQKLAEGYELLRKEHMHPDFKIPLKFDSEGLYIYEDVVALVVHKRILYGRRKKALQVSLNQLANRNRPPRVKVSGTYNLSETVPDIPFKGAELYSDIL